MAAKFGDRVQAVYGGPIMLVVDDLGAGRLIVAWKDEGGVEHEEVIIRMSLRVIRKARQK